MSGDWALVLSASAVGATAMVEAIDWLADHLAGRAELNIPVSLRTDLRRERRRAALPWHLASMQTDSL